MIVTLDPNILKYFQSNVETFFENPEASAIFDQLVTFYHQDLSKVSLSKESYSQYTFDPNFNADVAKVMAYLHIHSSLYPVDAFSKTLRLLQGIGLYTVDLVKLFDLLDKYPDNPDRPPLRAPHTRLLQVMKEIIAYDLVVKSVIQM
jgi:hypothetical protein